jgi:signal transduction histidine kinase
MQSGAGASQPTGQHASGAPGAAGLQAVEPLTLLRQLFRAVPNVPRFDLLLEQLLRASVHTIGATCAAYWHFDWGAQTRSVVMSYADGRILRDQLWPGAQTDNTVSLRGWPGVAALRDTPAPLQFAAADAPLAEPASAVWPLAHPGGATLLVPVIVDDDLAGCLSYHQPHAPFTDEQIAVAQESAGHVSLAISVTALAERGERLAVLEERQRQLEAQAARSTERNAAFQRSLAALTDDPDLDAFLGYTLYDIAEQLGAAMGDIFLFDPVNDTLASSVALRDGQIARRASVDEPTLFQQPFPAAITPAFAELCQARTLLLLSDERYDLLWPGMAAWHRAQGNNEALAVALFAGEQPLGVLGLAFRDPFPLSADQRQAVQLAANQATLAIQLSQLAGQSRRAAMLEERTRLAREIHDTLAQGLTGIIVHLQAATNLHTTDPDDHAAHLAAALALARHSLTEARRSVQALRPSDLAQADLAGALGGLTQRLGAQAGVVINYATGGTLARLPDAVEADLLRIAQEALANALTHAAATQISVALTVERGQLRLLIADDGCGFELTSVAKGHFGLVGMRERAQRIGAVAVIRSAPGQGCSVLVILPLEGAGRERSSV